MLKKYHIYFFTTIFLLASPILASFLFMKQAGEMLSVQEVVKNQFKLPDPSLAYMFTQKLGRDYKLTALDIVNPKIVVAGSSRSMQFRQQFFTEPFYNLGGSIESIYKDLKTVINRIIANPSIQTVLISVDPWWFNADFDPPEQWRVMGSATPYAGYDNPFILLKPYTWMLNENLPLKIFSIFSFLPYYQTAK